LIFFILPTLSLLQKTSKKKSMKFFTCCFWFILLNISNFTADSQEAIGFVPSLSSNCSSALSLLAQELDNSYCGPILSKVLVTPANFTSCSIGTNG
jgi:hypothetical protein